MTRIFDALKKVQASRPAAEQAPAAPTPTPIAAPALRSAPARSGREPAPALSQRIHPPLFPLAASGDLGDDVIREMTTLRVTLESTLVEHLPRVVMFLASQGGEGTSTVAAQFALTVARDSRMRVLLVDAHANRPAIGPQSARSSGRRPAYVVEPGDPERIGNLDLLPLAVAFHEGGTIDPNAARDAIESSSQDYDWVVIDGPPVLESPDAAPLSAIADGTVVVVQAGRTKRPVLSRSVDLLRKAGARVVGSVLNRRRLEIPGFIYRRI